MCQAQLSMKLHWILWSLIVVPGYSFEEESWEVQQPHARVNEAGGTPSLCS